MTSDFLLIFSWVAAMGFAFLLGRSYERFVNRLWISGMAQDFFSLFRGGRDDFRESVH